MTELNPSAADFISAPPGSEPEEEKTTSGSKTYQNERSLNADFDWKSKFRTDMVSQVEKWAAALGVSKFALDSLVRSNMDGAIGYITQSIFMPARQADVSFDGDVGTVTPGAPWQPETGEDWDRIWNAGLLYFSALSGVDLAGIGTGSRGSGRRGPTAADIRNSFDEDQLTDAVEKIWGAHLLEDAPNARGLAKQYIEAIVASGGQQEIDFQTFVKTRMEQTSRWQQLYQNKPEGQDPLQYIGPYLSMAQSAVGGGRTQANSLAAGAAALGASQDAFAQRLQRTDEMTGSTGFINGLEDRVRGVKDLLRG